MRRRLLVAGLLALLAVAQVEFDGTRPEPPSGAQPSDHRVVIPRLGDDTTVAEARTTLEGLGLVVELESVTCATHGPPSELVLDISPRPGRVVRAGHVVLLGRCLFP